MLPLPAPPALLQAPPPGEAELLEAFDWGNPLPEAPALRGTAALDHAWLRAAATFDPAQGPPPSPFRTGPGQREAVALAELWKAPRSAWPARLATLPLQRSGTALALWRWGRLQARSGAMTPRVRRLWEDRLLGPGPVLVRGYALRHALCWALAEADEPRLVQVRRLAGPGAGDLMPAFQGLFMRLGAPAPTVRLWSLPGLAQADLPLDQLGPRRIWIHPAEDGPLPEPPAGSAWIIPSATGPLDPREASLDGPALEEARALADRLAQAGRTAHYAPSRAALEALGILWFPAQVDLDAQGRVTRIRMGDAAW